MKNTKNKGVVRFFIYKEGAKYVGVCLDFDIIEEGKDVGKLKRSLLEAAQGHVGTVIKEGMNDKLLNRRAPKKYWKKYEAFLNCLRQKEFSPKTCSLFTDATVSSVYLPLLQSCKSMV